MLPEDIAQSILARATEIDARYPAISVDELRAIAAELHVSETALDAALKEHHAATPRTLATSQRGALAVAALGLPMGLVGGSLLSAASTFAVPSIWLLLTAAGLLSSTGLIVLQSRRPSLASYVLQNTILWGGIGVGALSALSVLGSEVVGISPWFVALGLMVKHWLPSTILGSAAATALLRAESDKRGDPDVPLHSSPGSEPGRIRSRVRRLLDWLNAQITVKFNSITVWSHIRRAAF